MNYILGIKLSLQCSSAQFTRHVRKLFILFGDGTRFEDAMSAGSIADMCNALGDVRFVPKADMRPLSLK